MFGVCVCVVNLAVYLWCVHSSENRKLLLFTVFVYKLGQTYHIVVARFERHLWDAIATDIEQ